MLRWTKRIGVVGAVLAVIVLVIATISVKLPGSEMTPAGFRQETSTYLKMRDGVEIAVTVLLPPDMKGGERVPVLMRTTRYWRGQQLGSLFALLPKCLAAICKGPSNPLD